MFLFKKIRTNVIFLFVLSGLIPSILIGLVLLDEIFYIMKDNIIKEHKQVTNQVGKLIGNRFNDMEREISKLAKEISIKTFNIKKMNPILKNFFKFAPVYYNIHLYDVEGIMRNVCYYSNFSNDKKKIGIERIDELPDLAKQNLLSAMKDKKTKISDFIINSHNESIIMITAPIFDFLMNKKIVGVISASIKIGDIYFHRILDSISTPKNGYVIITDFNGNIISKKGNTIPEDLSKFNFPGTCDYLSKNSKNYSGIANVNSRKDFISASKLPYINGKIIIGQPYYTVFSQIRKLLRTVFWVIILVIFITTSIAWYLGETLTKPIQELIIGINKIKDGILNYRIEVQRDDELGETITVFNDLAEKLSRNDLIESIWDKKWK
jgi:methyl-accepting chemotaxis protein